MGKKTIKEEGFFDRQGGMSGGETGKRRGGRGGRMSAPAGRWAFQRCQLPLLLHHTESSAAPHDETEPNRISDVPNGDSP